MSGVSREGEEKRHVKDLQRYPGLFKPNGWQTKSLIPMTLMMSHKMATKTCNGLLELARIVRQGSLWFRRFCGCIDDRESEWATIIAAKSLDYFDIKKGENIWYRNSAWLYIAIFSQGLGAALSFTISSFNIVRSWAVRTSLSGLDGNARKLLAKAYIWLICLWLLKSRLQYQFRNRRFSSFQSSWRSNHFETQLFKHYHLFDEMFGQKSHYDGKYTYLRIYIITLLLHTTTLHTTYPLQQKLYI